MRLESLKPSKGSVKNNVRLGRGTGSGRGRTSTRGHNGAKSRSGYSRKIGFEGGQMPLQRRVPKFGFTNFTRVEYEILNLSDIQYLIDKGRITTDLNKELLVSLGNIGKSDLLKILGSGELKSPINIKADKFSKSAMEAIKSVGGTAEVISA